MPISMISVVCCFFDVLRGESDGLLQNASERSRDNVFQIVASVEETALDLYDVHNMLLL